MDTSETPTRHTESPDPASHAANIYDTTSTESEWIDEADDDDMNADLVTEDSEDVEFFDPAEEEEGEYHGTAHYPRGRMPQVLICGPCA